MAGAAAKRYARAIFGLAQEEGKREGQQEAWADRLALIRAAFSSPDLRRVLENPTTSVEGRQEAAALVLGEKADRETLNLARLLVELDRVDIVGEIAEEYAVLSDEAAGRVKATATAAVELTEAEKEKLAARLSARLGKEVRLTTRVVPAILGGLVVQTGDRVIDASLATRLQQLRRRLAGV
jgi:F-type H+-transporting ATPase subunit delta